jgi:hypothetical protein
MAIGTDTVHSRSWYIMLLAPCTDQPPFLLKAIERESLATQECVDEIAPAITELHERDLFARAGTGNHSPIQVLALVHRSKRSQLNTRG